MSSFKSHIYLVGYAQYKDRREVMYMKPTAENIANFIMKHKEASVIITDEWDLMVVTAEYGIINICKDQEFLIHELHPAIIPIQLGEKAVGEIEEYDIDAPCDKFD